MKAEEWREWFAGRETYADEEERAAIGRLIADLAEMERLAIGGEGETHYYWRDACRNWTAMYDKAESRCKALAAELDTARHAWLFQATRDAAEIVRLEGERDRLQRESGKAVGVVADLIVERDRLQHIIDCAGTPLMANVLADRARLRTALQALLDAAHVPYTESLSKSWVGALKQAGEALTGSKEAGR